MNKIKNNKPCVFIIFGLRFEIWTLYNNCKALSIDTKKKRYAFKLTKYLGKSKLETLI